MSAMRRYTIQERDKDNNKPLFFGNNSHFALSCTERECSSTKRHIKSKCEGLFLLNSHAFSISFCHIMLHISLIFNHQTAISLHW